MPANKTKVLVVEDEASIRKFIAINLHRNDFVVLEAGDGETARDGAGITRCNNTGCDAACDGRF